MKEITAIILAAGKGTRIKADKTNKVLLPLAQKPMVVYIIDLLQSLQISPIIVVVGHQSHKVKSYFKNLQYRIKFVNQGRLLGTGHAVKKALPAIPTDKKLVLILHGDHSSFYKLWMIKQIIKKHLESKAALTFVTVDKQSTNELGRILRDEQGKVYAIKEFKNASEKERKIKEINVGTYCCSVDFLKKYLTKIKKDPLKQEYYLTDLVGLAFRNGEKVEAVKLVDESISFGVNTREELRIADQLMQQKLESCSK